MQETILLWTAFEVDGMRFYFYPFVFFTKEILSCVLDN